MLKFPRFWDAGILGVLSALTKNPAIAGAVRTITLSFPAFRNTESQPPKPREVQRPADKTDKKSPSFRAYVSNHNARESYRPSETMQATHWLRWQGLCGNILTKCTSLQSIQITFTSNFTAQHYRNARTGRRYETLFGAPDLENEAILSGLRASTNLRELHFTDPSPLEAYGPGLQSWSKLRSATIILSSQFSEISKLPETAFCPPKALEQLRLHDHQSSQPWPLKSDMAQCTDLKVLDLGVSSVKEADTRMAIGYLISSYQGTLTELTLTFLNRSDSEPSFEALFADQPTRLRFPYLQTLRLKNATTLYTLFAAFDASELIEMELGKLNYLAKDETAAKDAEFWRAKLSVTSLGRLKVLRVKRLRTSTKDSLPAACEAMGIELRITGSEII